MTAKHTPGPWHAQGREVVSEDGTLIAKTSFGGACHEDAALMAAAPDLLAALSRLVGERMPCPTATGHALADCPWCAARAALAKADP